jgi:hypothetical protein
MYLQETGHQQQQKMISEDSPSLPTMGKGLSG